MSYREVSKDCLFCYRGSRYSVPHAYAGKRVVVKEPVDGGQIRVCHQQATIAEHRLAAERGAMVINLDHYAGLPHRRFSRPPAPGMVERQLIAGPGVGRNFAVPEVEMRSLAVYEEVSHVTTV